ncbi:undecaprenyl-phosphate glucose phosphotransferase [Pontibacter anaerobius]|uniref:Undecaprenyl-phosphate glucose phosphotransferase n=1 Tax=Pontibacter anaerobius TaxID=2993940 RepID=A0ABT3RIR0_9BACT|nr:undecaprenyl-phosphate glucose phosphotransferase [Pontibacter anaerobius]MCX2741232.1 undecaprenyl-phosphate glucose phosphotransferase [Pontibacter anaerobius]
MAHKYSTLFKWINVVVDYFLLNGTLYFCFILADNELIWAEVYDYRLTIVLLNFSWFYSSNICNVYSQILKRNAAPVMSANVAALCVFISLSAAIKLLLPHFYIPPTPFIYYFVLFPAFIIGWRLSFLLYRKYKKNKWATSSSIAIVGASPAGIELYNYINANSELDYQIAGMFDDDPTKVPPHIHYLGNAKDSVSYASTNKISEIYCSLPNQAFEVIEKLILEADKYMVRFRLVPDVKGALNGRFMVELVGPVTILKPRQEPLENKANEIIKRAFDIVFSSLVLLFILSWLTPVLAVIIKLESKGPVFFKQLRSGKNNKSFQCLKFRSMALNNNADKLQACKGDFRVTRIGRILRKTSIDELPQFINVFFGNMSVVGPRPHMLKHTKDYSQLINNYMVRHFLTPGITGWAQVNGFRGETKETMAMLNRVQADLWYLENWTLYLDLKIVFLTVWQSFQRNENVY